jgi:diaminohydroxyphosphoribosylaminopyrimidine deaminase/5-amino-6-(5-phosphoribosylamino)uracil reductase
MSLALDEAWKYQGLTYPNPAVGALILLDGTIIALQAHKEAGSPHAEVLACQEAYAKLTHDNQILELTHSNEIHEYLYDNHNNLFANATIYTTLEPCNHTGKTPPCSRLLQILGFERVVIGAKDYHDIASGGDKALNNVEYIAQEEATHLIHPFELWQNKRFVFFKWAQSANGVIDGGQISSPESKKLVHQLRDKIDLIVIGGNTVREDHPTLDAREVEGKAPDVLIYSKSNDFDMSIPLFNVEGRRVHISDSLDILDEYNFIMIEGVDTLMEATKGVTNYYLRFTSKEHKSGRVIELPFALKPVHQREIGDDTLEWLIKE